VTALLFLVLFSAGVCAIGAGVGYGLGYGAFQRDLLRAKLQPIHLSTDLPTDYQIVSIRIGAYQLLTAPMPLALFEDGPLVRGRWIVGQRARMVVRLQCLHTGILQDQSVTRERSTF